MIAPHRGGAPEAHSGPLPCSGAPRLRVVVAMSGGVDSSVAAALLARAGHDVIGVTMKNFCYSHVPDEFAMSSCCSVEAIDDARRVADHFDFPHYVLDFEEPFGRVVIDDFVAEYAAGRTPNPCVRCNRLVRFPHLYARARALGADALATGHYARVTPGDDGRPRLLRGADRGKDQSYYLWGLTAKLLERTLFPVGDLMKTDVRRLAAELELEVAQKPESMEVCFIPDGDLRGFLDRERATRELPAQALPRFGPGPIVSISGQVLGEHPGSAYFTVGQRHGLGLALGTPAYVVGLRGDNTIVVGGRDDLLVDGCTLEQANWIAGAPPADEFDAEVQVRHRQRAVVARISAGAAAAAGQGFHAMPGSALVEFSAPISAIAPGQSAVLYRDDEVLGGGVIRESSTPKGRNRRGAGDALT